MKTAEEYIPETMPCRQIWINLIREIQLDAYHAGMTEAAEIVMQNVPSGEKEIYRDVILIARDKKTSV